MDVQTLINIGFAALGTMAGWILNRLWTSVDNLQVQDQRLAEKVQTIEVLVAGHYVQRGELADLSVRLFAQLERIEGKLDGKADK